MNSSGRGGTPGGFRQGQAKEQRFRTEEGSVERVRQSSLRLCFGTFWPLFSLASKGRAAVPGSVVGTLSGAAQAVTRNVSHLPFPSNYKVGL